MLYFGLSFCGLYISLSKVLLGDKMSLHFPNKLLYLTGFWDRIQEIPNNIGRIFSNAIAFLVAICFGLGVILTIVGAIQWATGWDNKVGKKTVVKGVVLIAISLVAGGLGVTIVTFT
jgi:hypothetical protein